MFAAEVEVSRLEDALDPVAAIVTECKLRLGDDGVATKAVDPANVAMVSMELDASAFESYQADGGVIGVDLEQLLEVLSLGDGDEIVELNLDSETRRLDISIGGLDYALSLIDPDTVRAEPDIPDLDLPCMAVVEGRELDRAATAADMVSNHIRIRSDGDALYVEAEGDTDDVEVYLGEENLLSATGPLAEADTLLSLDYVDDVLGPIGADTGVRLRLGEEFPIKLSYEIGAHCDVENMIAPRIQSE